MTRTFDIAAHVVRLLNARLKDKADADMQAELRRLVNLWLESGPHTGKLMHRHPGLIPERVPCFLISNGGGLAVSFLPAVTAGEQPSPEQSAMVLFLQLLTAPDCERVAGPCQCGCGLYLLRKSGRQTNKTFIQGHASRVSASKRMQELQAKKRAPKLRAVNRALAKYRGPRVHGDWREFVESETNFVVSIGKLAEWAAKGWIQAPA
jgi:hypothetical protein